MSKPLVLFNPKLPKLSKNEQEVLNLLLDAGKLITPLYEQQENHKFPGANFYPHGISKAEIEKASKDNPQILSPYTIVEKKDGKLIAIPYHEKYFDYLKPISDKLVQASNITDNKELAQRLRIQAEVLLSGDYEKATISWMSLKPYIIDINIGPVERYDDKLFFIKTSYQSWVGVVDEENTKTLNKYKEIILGSRRKSLRPTERVDYYDKVQTRVDDLLLLSGLIARTLFSGVNLPNEPLLVEKYGSEITLFKQTNQIRHKLNLAIFNKIFSPAFRKQFTPADLERGGLYSTALHELGHAYLRYRDAEKRLQDLFPVIDELGATIMGVKVSGALLVKDIIDQKQVESIMLSSVLRAFYNILHDGENLPKYHYRIGWVVLLNYLLESGAIKEAGGVSWPNFMKMFLSMDELATSLERILSQGTRKDAADFIAKYGDVKKLQKFKKATK